MADPFVPEHIRQGDFQTPANGEGNLCWAASGAMAVAFATAGKKTPSPIAFRIKTNKKKKETGNVDAVAAGCAAFGVVVQKHEELPWDEFVKRLQDDPLTGFVLFTDYEKIPDKKSCLPTFDGAHVIWVAGGNVTDAQEPGKFKHTLYDDPLCAARRHIPLFDLRNAGEKYATDNGHPAGTVVCGQVKQG